MNTLVCIGGPYHGKPLPNRGGTAHVVAGGRTAIYERDSYPLLGVEFPFWRHTTLPRPQAYEMLRLEAKNVLNEMIEVAGDMERA